MHRIFLGLFILLLAACKSVPSTGPVIYLAGDSTIADKRDDRRPETGWGEKMKDYFDERVTFVNHAVNGRSTKSFRDEGRWETILAAIRPGDYVMIGFGHNDAKVDTARFSAPETYQQNLETFVREASAKKAKVILLTPIVRRKFSENGNLEVTHGEYPDAARRAAVAMKVPLIDLTTASRTAVQNYGPDRSKELFLWLQPGENANYPEGVKDDTHLSPVGANLIAGLVARQITDLRLPLRRYLKRPTPVSAGK